MDIEDAGLDKFYDQATPVLHEEVDEANVAAGMLMDDEDPDSEVLSTLVLAGADVDQARAYISVVKGKKDPPTFMEVFGRGSIIKAANKARR